MRPATLLVLQHEPTAPAGLLAEWAWARRHAYDLRHPSSHPEAPLGAEPRSYDLLVVLGSRHAAYEDQPWIVRELKLLTAAIELGVPVFGICFGAQLLSRALGGSVAPARAPERGWTRIACSGAEGAELIGEGPWMEWHRDTFTVPPGAERLAESPAGPQAFRHGPHVAVQFHPEASATTIAGWVARDREGLVSQGGDPERIARETEANMVDARRRAYDLFDGVLRSALRGRRGAAAGR